MHNHLALSVIGETGTESVSEVARAVADSGCELEESHLAVFGSHFVLVCEVAGNWSALAKLEAALTRLDENDALDVQFARLVSEESDGLMPYAIEIVAANRTGIVVDVLDFLAERELHVQELHSHRFSSPGLTAAMLSIQLTVGIPTESSLAAIRSEFMDFCDDRNFDGILGPAK